MPFYELSILLRGMNRPDTVDALKRIGTLLLNKNVVLKSVESLGTKELPFRMPNPERKYYTMGTCVHKARRFYTQACSQGKEMKKTACLMNMPGRYFLYKFHGSSAVLPEISEECYKDNDVLRSGISKMEQAVYTEECTLDEEFEPPAKRKSVQKLLEKAKNKKHEKRRLQQVERKYFDIYM